MKKQNEEVKEETTAIEEIFKVVEVSTQTTPMIKNMENEELYDINTAIVKIMNDLEEIKKAVL